MRISKVIVIEEYGKTIKTLENELDLLNFSDRWNEKEKLEPNDGPPGKIKINIVAEDKTQIYLYDKIGTVRLLTKQITPEYKLKKVSEFNKLLGLEK